MTDMKMQYAIHEAKQLLIDIRALIRVMFRDLSAVEDGLEQAARRLGAIGDLIGEEE